MMGTLSRALLFTAVFLGAWTLAVENSHARRKKFTPFGITAYQSSYSNVSLSEGSGQSLEPSYDVELSLRMQTLFNFLLVYNQFTIGTTESGSDTNTIQGVGLGLKIDLPGYFLFGGKRRDSYRGRKKYPLNTFFQGTAIKTDTTTPSGQQRTSLASKYGIGMDLFLFNYVAYLSLSSGVYSYEGDSFVYTSGGLGLTF